MNSKKIGERLQKLRGSRTQKEVAEAISLYESGERVPRDEIKVRLANYYKRTVNFIFFSD